MQSSNIVKTIKMRRSVRSYMSGSIPEHDLYEILSAGLYAPSGKNRQPWRFYILTDEQKNYIADKMEKWINDTGLITTIIFSSFF